MCTLTYIPKSAGHYLVTSNRDESPGRKTLPPDNYEINGTKVVFPKDAVAGGTWIAICETGKIVCLLNGAYRSHKHQPPYRMSRGIMLLESLKFKDTTSFIKKFDLTGIEPFTFISFEPGNIIDFRWDGNEKYHAVIDPSVPNIWSSASLYKPDIIKKRRKWFFEWLNQTDEVTVGTIRDLHHFGGEGDIYNDFVMNRDNKVKTVSITSVEIQKNLAHIVYEDIIANTVVNQNLALL